MSLKQRIERAAADETFALLHIGTHKTGTTSFQRWALARRAELAKATGLEYYDGLFAASHWEIPMLCLRADRSMPMREKKTKWRRDDWQRRVEAHVRAQVARRARTLLVSSEALSYIRHRDELDRLIDLFQPRELWAVVMFREPGSFLRSYRQTMLSMGFPPSADRDSFAYVADDSWLVDYHRLLAVFGQALGVDRVLQLAYEPAVYQYGSVIPAILAACGFDLSGVPGWESVWHSGSRPALDH